MTVDEILEAISTYTGQLPMEAVLAAMDVPGEVTPRLLEMLDALLADPPAWAEREAAGEHITALFLLAQFREVRALPKLLAILALPEDQQELLLGDLVTEGLPSLLASLSGGDPTHLEALATDSARPPFVRGAAMEALLVLAFQGVLPEERLREIFERLVRIFEGRGAGEDAAAWACLAMACITGGFEELEPALQAALADGRVDPDAFEETGLDDLCRRPNAHWRRRFLQDAHLVEDALLELERRPWLLIAESEDDEDEDDDEEEDDDEGYGPIDPVAPEVTRAVVIRQGPRPGGVARNAPCPCGSGLKYKRCCGKDA